MSENPYSLLAERLDALPNGYPSTPSGVELRILEKLFTPEEALLASKLRITLESPQQIVERIGGDPQELRKTLKQMRRKGLIHASPIEGNLGFGLMPFVVGIYESQGDRIDKELADLMEEYFQQGLGRLLAVEPAVHRVIPVNQSIKTGLEVRPVESAAQIIANCQSWGLTDCICRKQKQLIGQGCDHPIEMCMIFSTMPGVFDHAENVKALTQEEALATLHRAAELGMVHSISNTQKEIWYICNCCTCSCGLLRGMAELGIANVVAKSSYVNTVDMDLCLQCGTCLEKCSFGALSMEESLKINTIRCTGCGVCVLACPEGALSLVLRPCEDQPIIPETNLDWMQIRAKSRQVDLDQVI
jgi:Na+-translocating ferredoxin:NAD+ oxidoreductase subunit B